MHRLRCSAGGVRHPLAWHHATRAEGKAKPASMAKHESMQLYRESIHAASISAGACIAMAMESNISCSICRYA